MALKKQEYFDKINAYINEGYDKQVASADKALGEAKADADASFERSKSAYGMRAEQLAQSGLAGSGYSDNLTREAYAARQAGYDSAYKTYNEMLRSAEQERTSSLLKLDEARLNEEKALEDSFEEFIAAIDYTTAKRDLDYAIKSKGYTFDQAKEAYTRAGFTLTEDAYNAVLKGEKAPITDTGVVSDRAKQTINSIGVLLNMIGKEGGVASEDVLAALSAMIEDDPSGGQSAFKAFIAEPMSNYGAPSGDTSTVGDYLYGLGIVERGDDGTYSIAEKIGGASGIAGISVKRGLTLRSGDNFKINVTGGDGKTETYTVQLGSGRVTNLDIINASRGVVDGGVFQHGGTLYVKSGGEIWPIEKTDIGRNESYADFVRTATGGKEDKTTYSLTHDNGTEYGDNITFKDSLGRVYKVEMGQPTDNIGAKKAAESRRENEPYYYDGRVYIKRGNTVYEVVQRNAIRSGAYSRLLANLKSRDGETVFEGEAAEEVGDNKGTEVNAEVSLSYGYGNDIGDNITVKVNGNEYGVQVGQLASDSIAKAFDGLADGIIKYGGNLYYKRDGIVRRVEARPVMYTGDYAALVAAVGAK